MARKDRVQEALARLGAVRGDNSPTAVATLRDGLADRSPHVVARASQLVGDLEISALAPALLAAFERLMSDPVKNDPNCSAKAAIADALYRLGADAEELFLRGARHVQMEPVWGGRADTAGPLRSACGFGLVRMGSRQALDVAAELLADPEARVRAEAARALGYSESEYATPVLRLKALAGDVEEEVIGECLTALLSIAPESSFDFVARFLERDGSVAGLAALALGSSRSARAFDCLKTWWHSISAASSRRAALLAIALIRSDEAREFLLRLIAEDEGPAARDAIAALAIYRDDERMVTRVQQAMQRSSVALQATFEKEFQHG